MDKLLNPMSLPSLPPTTPSLEPQVLGETVITQEDIAQNDVHNSDDDELYDMSLNSYC
ncbi:hypothetical protein DOLIC_00143 [Dolichomitus sp. PSUC_FEM 10030005]|nr:hypothetical protein [Dolichomitus sp. PSUC_FEM 10030005]